MNENKTSVKIYLQSMWWSIMCTFWNENLAVACRGLVMPGPTASLYAPLPNYIIKQWRMVVIYAVGDVTIWRDIHVCKPTVWRSLLTQHAYFPTRTLLTRFCTMCHCNEHISAPS